MIIKITLAISLSVQLNNLLTDNDQLIHHWNPIQDCNGIELSCEYCSIRLVIFVIKFYKINS